jgi:hypothetical protein
MFNPEADNRVRLLAVHTEEGRGPVKQFQCSARVEKELVENKESEREPLNKL